PKISNFSLLPNFRPSITIVHRPSVTQLVALSPLPGASMIRWLARLRSSPSGRKGRPLRRLSLRLEQLEDRLVPATITVTGTGDTIAIDGLATLREAITSINNQADVNGDATLNRVGLYASQAGGTPDVINFNIAGAGVKTIAATAAEPTIVRPLTSNGYSDTGASA